jgi:hypothetical protein
MAKKLSALHTKREIHVQLVDRLEGAAERFNIKLILANNEMTSFHVVSQLTLTQQLAITNILENVRPGITITFSAVGEHFSKQWMGPVFIND